MTTDLELIPPDDALAEVKQCAPGLTQQELFYVYWRSLAIPPAESYRRAGFDTGTYRTLETRPKIREAMAALQEAIEPEYKVTRNRVQAIILEAIEVARRKDNPKTMIEGAVALANIAGLNQPTKLKIEHSTDPTQVAAAASVHPLSLRHLTRGELEAKVNKQRLLPHSAEPVDAQFEVIQ
jgi:hypothetical protein